MKAATALSHTQRHSFHFTRLLSGPNPALPATPLSQVWVFVVVQWLIYPSNMRTHHSAATRNMESVTHVHVQISRPVCVSIDYVVSCNYATLDTQGLLRPYPQCAHTHLLPR